MAMNLDLDGLGRDFEFTETDFQAIRQLIYTYAGISLSNTKKAMVYSRVGRRLRANDFIRFCDYLDFLKAGDKVEWQAFVNGLTTNLTSFFREKHHFPILAEHVHSIGHNHPIKLWCCAASTGEEAYTMAMTMVDVFGSYTPPVRILATDLNTQVLKTAADGIYPMERVENLSTDVLQRFFLKGTGNNAGCVQVRQELRDMISFQQLNLLDENWPIHSPFDAVFCRNVMIYFDKPTQHKVLQKIVPVMRRDALFFAGHSENFHHAQELFSLRGNTVYNVANEAFHLSVSGR
ncbi:MAG: chemotaxis protein methyltransferase [Pseudomonadota bacterium]|jgi:chemotaxis protein methyltransferase CheR